MSPHRHETRRRPAGSAALTARWDHYLATHSPRAHGDLLREVDGFVRAEAGRLLGHGHPLTEEVAQEALLGAARRVASGERPDFPAAYLRKIVSNKIADLLERENRRRDHEQQHWTPTIEAVEASASADWHDFLDTIRTIVSADEFWTLILRYHFDYSYGEIGNLLDKEPNAIRQIALRGRRKCRDHLTRLEGRVPAWLLLPDAETPGDSATAEVDAGPGGDASPEPEAGPEPQPGPDADANPGVDEWPGLREPRKPDPADRSRRPPAGSDSGSPPSAGPEPTARSWRRRPRLRPDGIGRPFGSPSTVVPLVVLIALPVLFQVDRALDAAVEGPRPLLAEVVGTDAGSPPPSGPTISVTLSTAPTARTRGVVDLRTTDDESGPPDGRPRRPPRPTGPYPSPSSEPPPPETTSAPPTTRPAPTTTTTTAAPPTTTRSTTSSVVATRPATTAVTTAPATTSTIATSTTTSPPPPTTTTTTATTAPPTTTSTSGRPTTTSRATTTGRDPGDGGGEPPPNQ